MKQRSTTPAVSHKLTSRVFMLTLAILMLGVGVFQIPISSVSARDYDAEIRGKENEAARYQNEVNRLAGEANTLQRELGVLSAQISQIESEIALSQSKHDKLVEDIEKSKLLIGKNREALGEILADIYIDDQVTPLELLASSETIGDYIDKQENRSMLRQGLNAKIKDIKVLQRQQEQDREEVQKIIDNQKMQQEELASKRGVQQGLLDKTKGDEAAYMQMVQQSQGEINKLRQAQEELQRLRQQGAGGGTYIPVSGGGNYPYGHIKGCYSEACADPWRLFYSECTSYVAWKLSSEGYGVRPFTWQGYPDGHAYQWIGSVTSYAVSKRTSNPKPGDAAVFPAGVNGAAWTGHVMYVEDVYSNGTILISEYNWDGYGSYSKRELRPSEYRNTTFITFPKR